MTIILLISHSPKLVEGLAEMITQMAQDPQKVQIVPVGGNSDGGLGTDPLRIADKIQEFAAAETILVFCDIGSSVLSAESALDLLEDETLKAKVKLVDAPLVEGAFAAGVSATVSPDLAAILADVEEAKKQQKFSGE